MGVSTVWCMNKLYGVNNIFQRFIHYDQGTILLQNPEFTTEEIAKYGCLFTTDTFYIFYNNCLKSQDSNNTIIDSFEPNLFTDWFKNTYPIIYNKSLNNCKKYYHNSTAEYLYNHVTNNYVNLIDNNNKITIPTIVFGGELSVVNPKTNINTSNNYYTNSSYYILSAEEHGSHMGFVENYALVNQLICNFLINN